MFYIKVAWFCLSALPLAFHFKYLLIDEIIAMTLSLFTEFVSCKIFVVLYLILPSCNCQKFMDFWTWLILTPFCISNQILRLCNVTSKPLSDTKGKDSSPFSDTVFEVVENMRVPVTVLHITPMSALRSDAHVGIWSDGLPVSDCSHWCLPGVPDIWNEILLSYLFPTFKGTSV